MEKQVPEVVLSSGHRMPLIAMGTGSNSKPENLVSILVDAIEMGYRHLDTASLYGTEESVGKAVAEAIQRGIIKSRAELFITSKLWCTDAHHDLVLPALKSTLQRLGLEYVNLYLIHAPLRLKKHQTPRKNFNKEDVLPFDIKGTWEAMEECSRLGLAKSIGVSNYSTKKLSQILEFATIPPAVNQVEMNVAWKQKEMIDFCVEKGIHVSAWSPLGANGSPWGTPDVMESPILKEIAVSKGKTVAKVALRWIYEQGASPIVRSFNKERMKQNLQIFDWELNEEDVQKIEQIPQRGEVPGKEYVNENVHTSH